MTINDLDNNLRTNTNPNTVPVPNFKPQWINNLTRLNAQNLNSKMYTSIKDFTESYGKAVLSTSNANLANLLKLLPGKKVSDTSTSEIHNIDFNLASTNEADGNYQAVFGIGNKTSIDVDGQFVIGTFAKTNVSEGESPLLFAIGNGTSKTNASNAFSINEAGSMQITEINAKNGNITNITSGTVTVNNTITSPIVNITQTPTSNTHGTNKKYVDDNIEIEKNRAISAETNLKTALDNEISRAKGEEDSIRAIASSAFHFKGTKPSYADLPKTGNIQGDVWQVGDKEYAWNGDIWVELGFNVDLTPYIKTVDAEAKIATAKSEAIDSSKTYTDTQLVNKQNTLVSGTNIKTINNQSILGSGNINIEGGGGGSTITVDSALSTTSTNPVQNKVITNTVNKKQDIFGTVDINSGSLNLTTINKIATPEGTSLCLSGSVVLQLVSGEAIEMSSRHYTQGWDYTEEAIVITFK